MLCLAPKGGGCGLHSLDGIEQRLVVQVHRYAHTGPIEGCPNVLLAIEEVPVPCTTKDDKSIVLLLGWA